MSQLSVLVGAAASHKQAAVERCGQLWQACRPARVYNGQSEKMSLPRAICVTSTVEHAKLFLQQDRCLAELWAVCNEAEQRLPCLLRNAGNLLAFTSCQPNPPKALIWTLGEKVGEKSGGYD
ncbi:unnamed protein product [Ixodes pacificus]